MVETTYRRLLPIKLTEAFIFLSFWLFGTVVTMQYKVVLTAANDLVGGSAPPGLILFAYTIPSVLVRMFVPYIAFLDITPSTFTKWFSAFLLIKLDTEPSLDSTHTTRATPREVNYAARLTVCAASSFFGLQLLAWGGSVGVQVVGIGFASLSSNLGDMSFYQLATRYPAMITQSFGGYVAGSGAAGLIGSFVYTLATTSFGARPAAIIAAVGIAPSVMLCVYFFVLPLPEDVEREAGNGGGEREGGDGGEEEPPRLIMGSLKLNEKLQLVRPMIWGYMAPLAILMFLENVTTQGILPTIIWTLPLSARFRTGTMLDDFFRTAREFYPAFFTIHQLAIFFGRTSITLFRLPGGNCRSSLAYYGLSGAVLVCFFAMLTQSLSMADSTFSSIDHDSEVQFSPIAISFIVFAMGLCGGLGLSNTYWRVSKKPLPPAVWKALEKFFPQRMPTARWEGAVTPVSPSEEEESYFYQHGCPRRRLRQAFSPSAQSPLATAVSNGYGDDNDGSEDAFGTGTVEGWEDAMAPLLPAAGRERMKGGRTPPPSPTAAATVWSQSEETALREFLISTIALPDILAILAASLASLWLQPKLCQLQVDGGREYCRGGGGAK